MKRKFWKITLILICLVAILSVLSAVIFVHSIKQSENFTTFDNDKFNKVYSSLMVLDNTGNALKEAMYFNNIKQVPLTALPKYTYMAFVAVEDKRFFYHKGIDVKRVVGAMLNNIKSKSFKEGASTISQQLIKNTHLDNEKTINRKVNEMFLAMELEQNYTKEQILEMYLNTIYFGRNAYGIENAANVYFDKSAESLTLSESATLAGMIKAPNTYAPDKNIDKCRHRRNIVLGLMYQQGIINDLQYQSAISEEIHYVAQKRITEKTYMYYALKEACKILNMTETQLLSSNYTIETFCDQYTQRQLYDIATKDYTTDINGNLSSLACVVSNNDGKIIACYMRGDNADSRSQVGSALKPIAVYAPALDQRIITQASPILDEPTDFNGYKPQNVANCYNGWITVKQAVARSLNIPAVKTLNALTISTAQKYLEKLGFVGEQNLSLALGNINGGATPLEVTKCYTALANNGIASETQFVKEIHSNKGVIYTAKQRTTQVYQPTTSFLMTDMLLEVVNSGTAKTLKKDYQIAAKTGTVGNTNGNTDALVAGYTTQNTFVIWHKGQFDNATNGSNAPCKLLSRLLDSIYKEHKPANFQPPDGVVKLTLDKRCLEDNQQLNIAKTGIEFWFDKSNRPTEKAKQEQYSYCINTTNTSNGILLTLPSVTNGRWEFVKIDDNKQQL